jgi:O-antigen/teichoic acid export membrane protein
VSQDYEICEALTDISASELPSEDKLGPGRKQHARVSIVRQLLSPSSALHQSALSLADQGIASATNFLTGIIIARSCSKEELGLYALGFSLVLLLTDLQTSLITTPYMVYAPRLKGKAHALYTGSTLIHQLVFCLVTMVAIFIGTVIIKSGVGPATLVPVLRALVLVSACVMLREHARRVSFARLKLKTALVFDASIAFGQTAGLLLLAHFGLLSAKRAYWVVGIVCGCAVIAWLWSDREFYNPRLGESFADFKKNWTLGKWIFASGLVWVASMNLYPWLLAAFHGVASTGIWAACLGVVSAVNPVLLGVQNLVGPKISHIYAEQGAGALRNLILKISVAIAFPMSLLCLVMFVWAQRLLGTLYGQQYANNGMVVAILSFNLLVTALAFPYSRALFAINRARLDFWVNFTALFIMLTVGLWLVRAYGPLGAAIGLLGANLATSLVRAAMFLRMSSSSRLGVMA